MTFTHAQDKALTLIVTAANVEPPKPEELIMVLAEQLPKLDLATWDGVQQTIVNHYGGDPNARDAARVLRLPGYRNVKNGYPDKPACKIIHEGSARYTWQQILEAFPPEPVTTATGRVKGESLDLRATLEQFTTGTNYHEAGIALVGYFYNKGTTDAGELVELLQSLMDIQGDENDPRFEQRRNKDIPGSVDWIIKQRKKEQAQHEANAKVAAGLVKKKKLSEYTQCPMPGGGLYLVFDWVKSLMKYPNDTTVPQNNRQAGSYAIPCKQWRQ